MPSPAFGVVTGWDFEHSDECAVVSHYLFAVPLTMSDGEHLFTCSEAIHVSSSGRCPGLLPIFKIRLFPYCSVFKSSFLDNSP